ncbi:MAG: molybdenum cofactor biosynthesis protein MoaE [Actinobacteria bacterium]|nr:molybdenum cofactor biosynthesis protein MoaE [Actinomycetota bacterium]
MPNLDPPPSGDDWIALTDQPLPLPAAAEWAVLPSCGAVVTFSGTARDHAEGREGVERLEYEAYDEHVIPRLREIAAEARRRWPDVGRLVLLHRVGVVPIGASSVFVAASSPHRGSAFEAARFGIDTLKATAPIWKRETWAGGESWGLASQPVTEVERSASATPASPTKLVVADDGPGGTDDEQQRVG